MTRSYRPFAVFLVSLGLSALGCGGMPTTGGPAPAPEEGGAPPKAEIRGDANLNADEADYAQPRDFTFTVANTGGSPLELKLGRKSCTCSEVDLPSSPIMPGTQGHVVVHWTPAIGSAGAFTLAVDVQTNDPKNKTLHFFVNANVRPLVRVLVEGKEDNAYLDFGDEPIPPGVKRTREIKVFSTKLKAFKLNATCSEPGIEIVPQALPAGTSVGAYDNVLSGYTLEISTTPDLPPGYVRAQLDLALSQLGDDQPDRKVTMPLYAVAGQGICTISSPGYFLFSNPKISDAATAKLRLTYINATGKEDVTVERESVEPSFLQVDKPERGLDGKWLLTVHLPANNPEAAKYQADPPMIGKVVLKVAGLERPVTVRVKWNPLPTAKP